MDATSALAPLLEIRDLGVQFRTARRPLLQAVDGVSLRIAPQETLGLVGESGCGKSVTALAVMGLIPSPPGQLCGGEILFHRPGGLLDLAGLPPAGRAMQAIRGNEIAMIFQEPMTSLNPVYTVGSQIVEAIVAHQRLNRRAAREKAAGMLAAVGIPLPRQRLDEYPHQLSGGMRQRVMIAMALSCNPALLIADEPTTALDVTIQAQVLDLMNRLRKDYRAAILFITHDLGVIARMADGVAVMYLGRIVETAPVREIFRAPLHPYTQGLMKSIPSLALPRGQRLVPIAGAVPDPSSLPTGCGFRPRCPFAKEVCAVERPPLVEVAEGHAAACWLHIDGSN
jgi:oligopeptide/dipeptide ABC transporter ATP-binding protein